MCDEVGDVRTTKGTFVCVLTSKDIMDSYMG